MRKKKGRDYLLKEGGGVAIVLPCGSLTDNGVKERIRKKLLRNCHH